MRFSDWVCREYGFESRRELAACTAKAVLAGLFLAALYVVAAAVL